MRLHMRVRTYHKESCTSNVLAGHTVTVIKDAEGSIYGGYVGAPWGSGTGAFVASPDAFLFCLASSKMPSAEPFKMPIIAGKEGTAIFHFSLAGPIFGSHNLSVFSNMTVTCNIGGFYTAGPTGATISSSNPLAVAAMEVWQLADA